MEKKPLKSNNCLQKHLIIGIREKTILAPATPAARWIRCCRTGPHLSLIICCNFRLAAAARGLRQRIRSLSPTIGTKPPGAAKIKIR